MKKMMTVAALAVAVTSFVSCKKKDKDADLSGTYNSAEVMMGNGKVYSWASLDKNGNPTAVGFTLNDAALNGLPAADTDKGHTHEHSYEMILPSQASKTPFNHIVIDWNPAGHEPAPIYTIPHFDFHLYMISKEERANIPPYEVDSTGFKKYPSADYLPSNYINPGGGVPEMGTHWIDMNTPELHGNPFTLTFIYGTYNGQVNFIEPMITYNYLKSLTDYNQTVPRAAKVAKSGYYPTRYRITHANGAYTVSFEGMEWRDAS